MFTQSQLFCDSSLIKNIIVTSYVGCLYLFWPVWKEKTHGYTMVQRKRISGGSVFKFIRHGNHVPFVNRVHKVTDKGLVNNLVKVYFSSPKITHLFRQFRPPTIHNFTKLFNHTSPDELFQGKAL